MSSFDWKQFKDEVRRSISVPDFLSQFTRVRYGGGENAMVDCPFCRPGNFEHGRAKRDRYRCFRVSCTVFSDRWVDIFALTPELIPSLKGATEQETFINTAKYLSDLTGIPMPGRERKDTPEARRVRLYCTAISFYHYILQQTPEALEYLRGRGISDEQIQQHRMGYAPGGKVLYNHLIKKGFTHEEIEKAGLVKNGRDFFFKRVIIDANVTSGGTIYGRSIEKETKMRHLYLPGRMNGLFGLKANIDTILLSEGFFDALVQERGIDYLNQQNKESGKPLLRWGSVASYGTCGFKEEYMDDLTKSGVKNVVVTMDGDMPGLQAALKVSQLLHSYGFNVRVAVFPDGEDPNSFILNKGYWEWAKIIKSSLTLVEFRVLMAMKKYKQPLNQTDRVFLAEEISKILSEENELIRDVLVQEVAKALNCRSEAIYKLMRRVTRTTA